MRSSHQRRPRFWGLAGLFLALTLSAGLAACGDDDNTTTPTPAVTPAGSSAAGSPSASATQAQKLGSLSVLGIWGSDELTNFEAMVKPWQDQTGGKMNFTGTRNITADLTVKVQGNNPPDVAIPAEIGLFQQYAKAGKLTPLSACPGLEQTIKDKYPKAFVDLGTVDGKLYGFFMKADTKATIWYNPQWFSQNGFKPLDASAKFQDLVDLSNLIKAKGLAPWSMGVESAESSGWPGTDWIQQIILNEAGTDTYDGIVNGTIKFTDPKMKDAWQKFGQIALGQGMTSQGGAAGINATNFKDSSFPPFDKPPKAAMVYLGSFAAGFIQTQYPSEKAGTDYDFFTWPGGGVTGSANIVYAFNSNPTTCSFLSYLASANAQKIWVQKGGFTSVNKDVSPSDYPDPVAKKVADQLLNAKTFRFDLDDAIGGKLQQAEFQGVTQYLQNPGSLDSILSNIEAAR